MNVRDLVERRKPTSEVESDRPGDQPEREALCVDVKAKGSRAQRCARELQDDQLVPGSLSRCIISSASH